MVKKDLHIHTAFCDGKNTPEEMVLSALEKGLDCIGFSSHSFTSFDKSYAMSEEGTRDYISEISRLKSKYKGKIQILCGIEQDYYAKSPDYKYDYVIGSVHYVKAEKKYIPVDESETRLAEDVGRYFAGDILTFCEKYYELVGRIVQKTGCDIIGHFDLVSKFNEGGKLFDSSDERYVNAWKKAADTLLESGKLFEINTGAISRGYRTMPYPEQSIYEYIKGRGGKFILSSDSHSADTVAFGFDSFGYMV